MTRKRRPEPRSKISEKNREKKPETEGEGERETEGWVSRGRVVRGRAGNGGQPLVIFQRREGYGTEAVPLSPGWAPLISFLDQPRKTVISQRESFLTRYFLLVSHHHLSFSRSSKHLISRPSAHREIPVKLVSRPLPFPQPPFPAPRFRVWLSSSLFGFKHDGKKVEISTLPV